MRIVFFSKGGPEVPSSRYRCFRVADELRRQGVEVDICDPPPRRFGLRIPEGGLKELWRLHLELCKVRRGDILYLQRPTHNTLFVWLAVLHKKLRRLTMVFDFCDPLYVHSPFKTRLLTKSADLVIVSCEDLAEYARRYNDDVHVIPNSVLPEEIADGPSASGEDRPVVGWVGAASLHERNLEILLEPFARVAARSPFTFRLIGARGAKALVDRFRTVEGLCVDAIDWIDPAEIQAAARRLDIAVIPLQDIEWNRKLVTKLVEHLAAGVATLASPVGDNRRLVGDGVNGFLASDTREWEEKLLALLTDRELRQSLATKGLETMGRVCRLDANVRAMIATLNQRVPGEPLRRVKS